MAIPVKILVVEDETITAADIEEQLTDFGYHVVGTARTCREAIRLVEQERPDLVLLDIQLAGKEDGIETAKQINQIVRLPVIFLTAHAEQATVKRAMQVHPAAYVMKPFRPEEFVINIDLAIHNFFSQQNIQPRSGVHFPESVLDKALFVPSGQGSVRGHEKIWKADILYLEGESSYTTIFTAQGTFMLSATLKTIANQLTESYFLRISKQHLVNLNHIQRLEKGHKLVIGGTTLEVGRAYRTALYDSLPKLSTKGE